MGGGPKARWCAAIFRWKGRSAWPGWRPKHLGYDFAGGRLDQTAHPFSVDIGPGDVRITTRFDERHFSPAFFGTLHEAGHALYDQGLPPDLWGAPRGDAVSLGIHESQSRLWENLVGRSLGFWRFFYPRAQATFAALKDVPLEVFHFAVNEVRPSLIRTEADEVTYNLHILLRFELERALMNGDLAVEELPGAFNDKMRVYLESTPPGPGQGVMQDVHWSAGLFGYFPTYTPGISMRPSSSPGRRRSWAPWRRNSRRGILRRCSPGSGRKFTPRGTVSGPGPWSGRSPGRR